MKMENGKNTRRYKKKNKKYRHFNFTEPITSFGLILTTKKDENILYLLYQRRDSVEYIEFVRGSWNNEGQLPALFSLMSIIERERIREYTFPELWDDLWVDKDCHIYRDCYNKALRKYISIKHKIADILDSTNSYTSTPPWGFPKGKKNYPSEDPLKCALREFKEETRIDCEIQILDIGPVTENFKGTNGKAYATHYYIGYSLEDISPSYIPTNHCIRRQTISEEAGDVGWFSFEDALKKLNQRRQHLLSSVHRLL